MHLADRSINHRSSHEDKSVLTKMVEGVLGYELWDSKTTLNHKVDAFLKSQAKPSKKQLRQTIEHDMTYGMTIPMFTGEIVMGEAQTVIDVVYDTGSDWLVIPDIDCFSCTGRRHDSSDATPVQTQASQRLYGSAALVGKTFKDKTCLTKLPDSCVADFEYFAFYQQQGINDPIEGILGLALGQQMLLAAEEIEIGPLFIDALVNATKIEKAEFSFALNGLDRDLSYLDIGAPDYSKVKGGESSMVKVQMYDDFFWSQAWQGSKFNPEDPNSAYFMEGTPFTIVDTGSSHTFIPQDVFLPFVLEIMRQAGGPEFQIQQGMVFVDCSSKDQFRPVQLMFDNKWITIVPDSLVWDVLGDGTLCMMLVMQNSYNFALMGQPLFQGYYTHHQMEEQYIAYGPLRFDGAPPLVEDETPTVPISKAGRLSVKQIVVISAFIAASVLGYYYVAYAEISKRYDRLNPDQKLSFDAATWGYFIFCFLVYHYVLGPALGINTGRLLQEFAILF